MPQKTPVHSVVSVICDILAPLADEERLRALNAVTASLGISRRQLQAADDDGLSDMSNGSLSPQQRHALMGVWRDIVQGSGLVGADPLTGLSPTTAQTPSGDE